MKSFMPKIEVRLVKTLLRTSLGTGASAAGRLQEFDSIDLTPYLMEDAPVAVQKYLGGGAGTWSVTLADRAVPGLNESLYGLLEPMDLVEIRMARSPHEYQGKLPIVMRGFVSSIGRTRSMSGGRPSRVISLAGHDYSKVLDILRIYYLNNSVIGDNIIGELGLFQKFLGLDEARVMSGKDFVELIARKVINPYIARLTRNAKGEKVGAAVMHELVPEVAVEGTVSPWSVSTFVDGSMQQFLGQFLDIGAFNEMFVDDREDKSVLVVRPNQFANLAGEPIQGDAQALADSIIDVPDEAIESIVESRTDSGVANYYWVASHGWVYIENITTQQLAAASGVEEYALFDYVNTDPARYGFRKMEVTSSMGPPGQNYTDVASAAQSKGETDLRIEWLARRRRILAQQNRDNAVLETGQIVMPGDERIRVGTYLRVTFGDLPALYYVVAVTHTFVPFQSFRTIVSYERGTGFVERAKRANAAYFTELNLKGAYESGTSGKSSS